MFFFKLIPLKNVFVSFSTCSLFPAARAQENSMANVPKSLLECYNNSYLLNRNNKLPQNVPTFLAILRKIEDTPGLNMDLRTLSVALLHRWDRNLSKFQKTRFRWSLKRNELFEKLSNDSLCRQFFFFFFVLYDFETEYATKYWMKKRNTRARENSFDRKIYCDGKIIIGQEYEKNFRSMTRTCLFIDSDKTG